MPTPPWKKKKPKTAAVSSHADAGSAAAKKPKTKLTPASIAWAKARAKEAGRRYPNLVDNMAASRRQHEAEHPKSERDGP